MQCSHSIGNRWQGTKERSCESAPACFSKNNKLGGWVICPRYEVAWSKVLSAQFNGHSFALSRTKHTNTISLQNTVCHFQDSINFQHGVSEFEFWATGLRSAVSLSDPKVRLPGNWKRATVTQGAVQWSRSIVARPEGIKEERQSKPGSHTISRFAM